MRRVWCFGLIALLAAHAAWAEDECADGESKKAIDSCNDCYCTKGAWACTRKSCDPQRLIIRSDGDADASCEDGQAKKEDCNSCRCSNGRWACTEMGCAPRR